MHLNNTSLWKQERSGRLHDLANENSLAVGVTDEQKCQNTAPFVYRGDLQHFQEEKILDAFNGSDLYSVGVTGE